jgi:DNA-binding response OmpR family regulator
MKSFLASTADRLPATDRSAPLSRYRELCLESGDRCDFRTRILYADDDRCILRACQLMLDRAGYDVDTVADGAEAWGALQSIRYQLLITDNEMPHLTGVQLIHKVRESLIPVPIVLASSSITSPDGLECDAVLPKPFTVRALLDTVRQVLLQSQVPPARSLRRCIGRSQFQG